MKHRFTTHLTALTAVALLLFGAGQALASTPAGTTITNLATLDYEVNGNPQPQLESDDGTPVEFIVDLLVNPLVTRTTATATVNVTPGDNGAEHTFRVDNLGNDNGTVKQYFKLTIATPTDNLGVTSILADIVFEDGTATLEDQNISAGVLVQIGTENFITVTLKANIPNTALDTETTVYDLIATATDSDGVDLTASGVPTAGQDTVFADIAGTAAGDAVTDGKHSDRGTFAAVSASFTVAKTDSVAGGYYIPGATVTYTINVTNNGAAEATSVTISDSIPSNTTYVGGLNCNGGTAMYSTNDGGGYSADVPVPLSETTNVQCSYATVAGEGGTAAMTFDVEIN